mmetsp:Transcript_20017/g.56525  ORF Transcript_20017/g.56525 Transcript_20017/m.56525 type:complete len:263 (+) Transcript_20017:307-1095(+)
MRMVPSSPKHRGLGTQSWQVTRLRTRSPGMSPESTARRSCVRASKSSGRQTSWKRTSTWRPSSPPKRTSTRRCCESSMAATPSAPKWRCREACRGRKMRLRTASPTKKPPDAARLVSSFLSNSSTEHTSLSSSVTRSRGPESSASPPKSTFARPRVRSTAVMRPSSPRARGRGWQAAETRLRTRCPGARPRQGCLLLSILSSTSRGLQTSVSGKTTVPPGKRMLAQPCKGPGASTRPSSPSCSAQPDRLAMLMRLRTGSPTA